MRLSYIYFVLALSSLALFSVSAEKSQAQSYYGPTDYYPPSRVAYYRPYPTSYQVRPTYYYSPQYRSYNSYYAGDQSYAPSSCESTSAYQQSQAPGYSNTEPNVAAPTTVVSVAIYDNRFEPATLNVQPGTTVRWSNRGQHVHTVTANDNRWDFGDMKPNSTYSATFKYPGTYYYYCRHHVQDKMQGIIVVGANSTGGARGTASTGY